MNWVIGLITVAVIAGLLFWFLAMRTKFEPRAGGGGTGRGGGGGGGRGTDEDTNEDIRSKDIHKVE